MFCKNSSDGKTDTTLQVAFDDKSKHTKFGGQIFKPCRDIVKVAIFGQNDVFGHLEEAYMTDNDSKGSSVSHYVKYSGCISC